MAKLIKVAGRDDWHGSIALGPYAHKRARFCADRSVSARWHAMLQQAVDRKAAGDPITPDMERTLPRRLLESFGLVDKLTNKRRGTFAENVADYVAELRLGGRDPAYIAHVNAALTAIGSACGWRRLPDVGREAMIQYLESRRAAGASPRTIKNDRATAVAFCLWAVGAGRLDRNPLASLPTIDDRGCRRRQRRALAPDEVLRLLAVAGPRELLYRVALGTGLRLGELGKLQWQDVRLDDDRPRLELRPEATKSRRADTIPLPPGLALRLRESRPAGVDPGAPVFVTIPRCETFWADCERAGIECRVGDVLTVGFHSLRVTFCSELERAGVSPRTIMQLMRHTDYKLTAGTYTDPRVLDTAGAVGRLPEYRQAAPDAIRHPMIGTEGRQMA
ncbi:MAG: tyrosine-type recombinase/integrase [Phycisphaerae bacterium]|nr:tyrosine-type recombinase/integrase [Phycisphaerae bacterium]